MTMPTFGGGGFGGGPLGGMGYTGGPMFDPLYYSISRFDPIPTPWQPSIARFDPIQTYEYAQGPSFEEMFARGKSHLDPIVFKIDRTPPEPFAIFGGKIHSLEEITPKKDYGIFNDAFGMMADGTIKHIFDR